jgi:PAS domain S-box-containing protein
MARDHESELEVASPQTETLVRTVLHDLPDAVFVAASDGRILDVNDAACRQLDYSREELLALRVQDIVAAEHRERVGRRLAGDGMSGYVESVHLRRDGTRVPVEIAALPIRFGGQPAFLGFARDITERKAAQERIAREATLTRAIIENAVEGICLCEDTSEPPGIRFTVWNRRMTEISGYTMDEINRLGWYQTVYTDAETQRRAADRMARMRRGENLDAEEWAITRKDGTRRTLLISTSVLSWLEGPPKVLGVMHDVTDRVRLEAQLHDAQRLEAIGRVAGAVAHDFNNLLTTILGGASTLADLRSLPPTDRALAEDVAAAARRGADLTRQLLTFSRRAQTHMRPLDLGAHVEESLRVVRRMLPTSMVV